MSVPVRRLRPGAATLLDPPGPRLAPGGGDAADRHPGGDVDVQTYDGPAVLADLAPWHAIYAEVYREEAAHADPPLISRLAGHAERDGFALVAAYVDGQPVGFLYGYTLAPDTLWWEDVVPKPDPEFVREYPGRTVGLCEEVLLPQWRGRGIAHRMYMTFLAGRREERGAAFIAPDNTPVVAFAVRLGAVHAGDVEPWAGWRRHGVYVLQLRPPATSGA